MPHDRRVVYASLADRGDDDPGAAEVSDPGVNPARGKVVDKRVPERVVADLTDKAWCAPGFGVEGCHVGGAAPTNSSRPDGTVDPTHRRGVETDQDFFEQVSDRQQHCAATVAVAAGRDPKSRAGRVVRLRGVAPVQNGRSLVSSGLADVLGVSLGLLHDRCHAQARGPEHQIVVIRCGGALTLECLDGGGEFVKAGIDRRPSVAEQTPLEALSFPRHLIPGLSTASETLPEARRWVATSDYGKKACGSFGSPLTRTSKWRWGPVEKPVLPTSPITSPRSTRSPGDAWITDMWA